MRAKLNSLAESIVLLPPKERVYLAERLLASLDEADVERQWAAEAIRRQEEIRSGRVKAIPAAEVYRRIDRLLEK